MAPGRTYHAEACKSMGLAPFVGRRHRVQNPAARIELVRQRRKLAFELIQSIFSAAQSAP